MKPPLTFWLTLVLIGLMGTKILLLRNDVAEANEAAAKVAESVANERTVAATKLAAAEAAVRAKETELRIEYDSLEKINYDNIQTANAHAADLSVRLRNSETRATRLARELSKARAGIPNQETPSGSPEPELLGEFGEEDVAEAKRAELIRSELITCYKKHDALVEALK